MVLSQENIYFFRSLLLSKISQIEDNESLFKRQGNYDSMMNTKNMPHGKDKISYQQFKDMICSLTNRMNNACLGLNINIANKMIDPILEKHNHYLFPVEPSTKAVVLTPYEKSLFEHEIQWYIGLFEFMKKDIVSKKDWEEKGADNENAFGLVLTPTEVMSLAESRLEDLKNS